MNHALAQIIAELLGLPDWAPRAAKKIAAWAIILAAFLLPTAFHEGMTIWVNQETKQIMKTLDPILTRLAEPTSAPPTK